MRPSLKSLPGRALDKAHESASGSPVPAGQEPPPAEPPPTGGSRERAAIRRRARKLRRFREVRVRELGALVVEMNRLGRQNEELLRRKSAEISAIDRELDGLARALGSHVTIEQVVAAGVAGSCLGCGSLLGTDDRFCARCGRPVVPPRTEQAQQQQPAQPAQQQQPPAVAPALGAAAGVGISSAIHKKTKNRTIVTSSAPSPAPPAASTPAPAVPPPAATAPATPTAPAPPAATTPGKPGTTGKPGATGGTRAGASGPLLSWPAGKRAYTVVLLATTSRQLATAKARQAQSRGLPAGVLDSRAHPGPTPGPFVVFVGQFPTAAAARFASLGFAARGFPSGHAQLIRK